MQLLSNEDIAGGKVQRAFTMGDRRLLRGTELTAEEVRRIPIANRNALVDKGFIYIHLASKVSVGGERFVVPLGFGRYDVVEGKKLNTDSPLSREAAFALAKKPLPKKEK